MLPSTRKWPGLVVTPAKSRTGAATPASTRCHACHRFVAVPVDLRTVNHPAVPQPTQVIFRPTERSRLVLIVLVRVQPGAAKVPTVFMLDGDAVAPSTSDLSDRQSLRRSIPSTADRRGLTVAKRVGKSLTGCQPVDQRKSTGARMRTPRRGHLLWRTDCYHYRDMAILAAWWVG